MKITTAILILGVFACCFATPTTKRPETPVYDDGENEDPFSQEREHPIDEGTWALWNQNPDRNCPWWEQHRYISLHFIRNTYKQRPFESIKFCN